MKIGKGGKDIKCHNALVLLSYMVFLLITNIYCAENLKIAETPTISNLPVLIATNTPALLPVRLGLEFGAAVGSVIDRGGLNNLSRYIIGFGEGRIKLDIRNMPLGFLISQRLFGSKTFFVGAFAPDGKPILGWSLYKFTDVGLYLYSFGNGTKGTEHKGLDNNYHNLWDYIDWYGRAEFGGKIEFVYGSNTYFASYIHLGIGGKYFLPYITAEVLVPINSSEQCWWIISGGISIWIN